MTDLRAQLQATLGGGYTIERELGGGGMSRVFVAREHALGRDVVVKVLSPELSADVSAERFTREIATAARLQHANIVPVLTAGTSGGVSYYTMPFVKGESLGALLARGVTRPLHERVSVLRDVARALAYAHGEGVVHRDIKPDNILLSAGTAVVTDFGIAKAISAARTHDGTAPRSTDGTLTQVGTSIGTPAYMAPEQAVGFPPTNIAAYDAYLLGRYHWNLQTTDGMTQATAAFKQAIAADSTYARAWSGLADAYALSVPQQYAVPGVTADSILPLAEAAARRAIALAPTLGEAFASLGVVLDARGRYANAVEAFERSIALSPAYATGHQFYGYTLYSLRRMNDATREMEVAHRLDPLAHVTTLSLAIGYDGQDRHADASALYAQGLAQQPQAWYAWKMRFGHDLALGHTDDAVVALQKVLRDRATDKHDVLAQFTPLWASTATREMATDSLIAKGPAFAAVPLARYLRNDSVVVAVVDRVARDPEQIEARNTWTLYVTLGPRLREDPRLQPGFWRLGFPEITSPGRAR